MVCELKKGISLYKFYFTFVKFTDKMPKNSIDGDDKFRQK